MRDVGFADVFWRRAQNSVSRQAAFSSICSIALANSKFREGSRDSVLESSHRGVLGRHAGMHSWSMPATQEPYRKAPKECSQSVGVLR